MNVLRAPAIARDEEAQMHGSGWVLHPSLAREGQLVTQYSSYYSRKVKTLLLAWFSAQKKVL